MYFPISRKEEQFDNCIYKDFRNLPTTNPEIIKVFQNSQPFVGNLWLQILSNLLNENKHRNLTKHKINRTTFIKNGEISGITLNNITIKNCEVPLMINNTPIDIINSTPYDHLFDASVEIEYVFINGNLPVISTLHNINDTVQNTINEFRFYLEQ